MTSCILLSAGESLRFGSPKALADLRGKTVIAYLLETLIASGIDEIIVVLGAAFERIEPHILKHKKVKVVYNKDYNLGQTSSFKKGLEAVSPSSLGIFLLPVDFPLVMTATVDCLIHKFGALTKDPVKEPPLILLPTYEGKKGHPPVFHAELKMEFLALDETAGINSVAHQHPDETQCVPVDDPGIVASFNTQEEFKRIVEMR